jgi:Holliday junction resolvase RusA-like endonuclease
MGIESQISLITRIEMFVPGDPIGQPRTKPCIRGKHAGVYDPGQADAWKYSIQYAIKRHRPPQPFSGPLSVYFEFYFRRPKSHTRAQKAHDWCLTEYDLDNLEKSSLDSINGIGIWTDDRIVAELHSRKYYGLPTGAWIIIEQLVN